MRRESGCAWWRTNWSASAAESATLQERWNREKAAISRVRQLKEAQEKARQEEEKATRTGDWEKAAQLKYGGLAQIEKELEAATKELEAIKAATPSAEGRN